MEAWELRQQVETAERPSDTGLPARLHAAEAAIGGTLFQVSARGGEKLIRAAERLNEKHGLALSVNVASGDVAVGDDGLGRRRTFLRVGADAQRIDGQPVLGRADAFGSTALFRHVPGAERRADTPLMRATAPACERCGHRRRRRDSFLLIDGDSVIEVGRCCLKHVEEALKRVDQLVNFALSAADAEAQVADEPGEPLLPLCGYLAFVAASVREHGWVRRTGDVLQGRYPGRNPDATADRAAAAFHAGVPQPTGEDRGLAERTVAFVREQLAGRGSRSDYENRLVAALSSDWLRAADLGVAASAVPVFQRDLQRADRRAELQGKGYVGRVGEKITTTATVKSAFRRRSYYGGMIYKLLDPGGNLLTWFASDSAAHLERGCSYQLTATVKNHEEYEGSLQTVITRCRVLAQLTA